jgi:hypothetical protein
MDMTESDLIKKVFIKGRGAEICSDFPSRHTVLFRATSFSYWQLETSLTIAHTALASILFYSTSYTDWQRRNEEHFDLPSKGSEYF